MGEPRAFHRRGPGPATEKLLSPTRSRVRDSSHVGVLAERSCMAERVNWYVSIWSNSPELVGIVNK